MAEVLYRDNLVIITSGTLTVGGTTYPLSAILSFEVTSSGFTRRDWPKTRKMFIRWLLAFSVIAAAVMFFIWQNPLVFALAILGAAYVAWRGDYHYTVIDKWWLAVQTSAGRKALLHSTEQSYIQNVATKLGLAMAHR